MGTSLAKISGPVTAGSVGLTGRAFTRGAPGFTTDMDVIILSEAAAQPLVSPVGRGLPATLKQTGGPLVQSLISEGGKS